MRFSSKFIPRARASTTLQLDAGTGQIAPSADTLHCDQDLRFATEIGMLLDASNIFQRSSEALLLYVGLRPIRFPDLLHTAPYERRSPRIV